MLTAADIARMKADVAEVIGDNEVSIIIRRGSSSLPAQTVRIERQGRASRKGSAISSEETKADIVVVGEEGLDIQKDDRFTLGGVFYRVLFRRPNELIGVQAEAEITG
jgi:hypothetical protein